MNKKRIIENIRSLSKLIQKEMESIQKIDFSNATGKNALLHGEIHLDRAGSLMEALNRTFGRAGLIFESEGEKQMYNTNTAKKFGEKAENEDRLELVRTMLGVSMAVANDEDER
ncbi:MAG: hypothetical protein ACOX2M_03875 [Fastidiosipilaceae bacterium]|jgi:hypothetical protein